MIYRGAVICFVLCLIGWGSLSAQMVSVEGQHPSYKGKTLHISVPGNPFIRDPLYSKTVVCDETGSFKVTFKPCGRRTVTLNTGSIQSVLYVEPGNIYRIELPEFREIPYSERVSPYFQPVKVPVRLLSVAPLSPRSHTFPGTELNPAIVRFDSLFTTINNAVVMDRRMGRDSNVDSLIHHTESLYTGDTSQFFRNYRKFKYGILKLNEGKTGLAEISRDYLGPDVRETHPAFIELFGAMFRDFFFYYSSTRQGKGIRNHINRTHQLDSLRSLIRMHSAVWSDTLADMVLLQELADVFYRGDYHKEAILILLDSMIRDPVNHRFRTYAVQVRQKLASLVSGHPPPRFSLHDTNGQKHTLVDFKGKYLYLIFCTPDHYGCMMEYPFLKSFESKHSRYLEVVSVMVAENRELVAEFMRKNNYSWKALYYGDQPGILGDYMVKAFPTAYLIGPEGNLIFSPAMLPTEGFEQQLFRIMRSRGEI